MDAYDPQTVDDDAQHNLLMRFVPVGSPKQIGLEIKARSVGKGGLTLKGMSAAVFAVSPAEGQAFKLDGQLPADAKPLDVKLIERPKTKDGWSVLWITFPRKVIPSGKDLAVPALVRYSDGWIYVSFYRTGVPAPLPILTPEQMQQRAKLRKQAKGKPGKPAKDKPAK